MRAGACILEMIINIGNMRRVVGIFFMYFCGDYLLIDMNVLVVIATGVAQSIFSSTRNPTRRRRGTNDGTATRACNVAVPALPHPRRREGSLGVARSGTALHAGHVFGGDVDGTGNL